MSDAAEKIRAIFDKAAVDALGKQLGRSEGTAHATITVTDDTVDVLIDFDPPSYLPMREHTPPRIPDLCPDDARDRIQGANHPPPPHPPETCTDPACDCMPFEEP